MHNSFRLIPKKRLVLNDSRGSGAVAAESELVMQVFCSEFFKEFLFGLETSRSCSRLSLRSNR